MKRTALMLAALLLAGCPAPAPKFSGCDLEVSTGTEQGVDQGAPTHKMVYGVLGRLRYDVPSK